MKDIPEFRIFEAKCPNCGSLDVELNDERNMIEDGVICFDCKTHYMLNAETGSPVTCNASWRLIHINAHLIRFFHLDQEKTRWAKWYQRIPRWFKGV